MSEIQIKDLSELSEYIDNQDKKIAALETKIKEIIVAVNNSNTEVSDILKFCDDHIPNTGILSQNFLQRAFSVWGHYFVAQLIIGCILGIVYLIITVLILAKIGG
jgi:hypothetical protein